MWRSLGTAPEACRPCPAGSDCTGIRAGTLGTLHWEVSRSLSGRDQVFYWAKKFGLGASFWSHFGGLGGFCPQARLGRSLGRLVAGFRRQDDPNLGPKMGPSSSQIRTRKDAQIDRFLDASKIENFVIFVGTLDGK